VDTGVETGVDSGTDLGTEVSADAGGSGLAHPVTSLVYGSFVYFTDTAGDAIHAFAVHSFDPFTGYYVMHPGQIGARSLGITGNGLAWITDDSTGKGSIWTGGEYLNKSSTGVLSVNFPATTVATGENTPRALAGGTISMFWTTATGDVRYAPVGGGTTPAVTLKATGSTHLGDIVTGDVGGAPDVCWTDTNKIQCAHSPDGTTWTLAAPITLTVTPTFLRIFYSSATSSFVLAFAEMNGTSGDFATVAVPTTAAPTPTKTVIYTSITGPIGDVAQSTGSKLVFSLPGSIASGPTLATSTVTPPFTSKPAVTETGISFPALDSDGTSVWYFDSSSSSIKTGTL
ncbi:MAG: hypothetical protein ACHREM_17805, partial [Polyangiales bacterium]